MTFRVVILQGLIWLRIIRKPDFVARIVPTHPVPEATKVGQVLIVSALNYKKWACFQCPEGCGEIIQLSLSQLRRPRWIVSIDWLGRPTINPSIRQLDGCRCHFWVRQGTVEWCSDSGK